MDLDADMYDEDRKPVVKMDEEVDPSSVTRDNALHLRGVDDMSTGNVHTYISLYTTDSKPRIEWIDDTSLNLVYYTAQDAQTAFSRLAVNPPGTIEVVTTSYSAQDNPEKPESRLTVRFATEGDKKEKGAKDRSRWYLFHPEDDPDSRPTRQGRDGRRSNRDAPYSRTGRHEKRAANGTAGGADLFANRLATRVGSPGGGGNDDDDDGRPAIKADLFEEKTKKENDGDIFASRVSEAAKSSRRTKRERESSSTRAELPADDLFSRIERPRSGAGLGLANRISGPQDLFAGRARNSGTGSDLASRIGGPVRNNGLSTRGSGRKNKASDMF